MLRYILTKKRYIMSYSYRQAQARSILLKYLNDNTIGTTFNIANDGLVLNGTPILLESLYATIEYNKFRPHVMLQDIIYPIMKIYGIYIVYDKGTTYRDCLGDNISMNTYYTFKYCKNYTTFININHSTVCEFASECLSVLIFMIDPIRYFNRFWKYSEEYFAIMIRMRQNNDICQKYIMVKLGVGDVLVSDIFSIIIGLVFTLG